MSDLIDAANEVGDGLAFIGHVLDERLAAVTAIVGPKGEKGEPGRDGVDGRPGRDAVGKQGPPGKDGRPGRDGIDGMDGADGSPGRPGKAGARGDVGPPGIPAPETLRVTVERQNNLIAFAQVFKDDGSTRRMAVRRDTTGRFTELVRVSA